MYLPTSINKKNLNEITIKSLVWNSIIETYKQKKDMDITSYLISIKIKSKSIIVKVNKPIVKSEILLIEDFIKEEVVVKFLKVGIKFYDFEIKYII